MTVFLAGPSAPAGHGALGSRPSLVTPVAALLATPTARRVMGLWLPAFPRRSGRFAPCAPQSRPGGPMTGLPPLFSPGREGPMTASTETRAGVETRTRGKSRVRAAKPAVRLGVRMRRNWQLYAMMALPLIWLAIFAYWPMYGVIIAFKDYNVVSGIWGSPWAGMKYFERFVESYQFWKLIKNTIYLHVYELVATCPLPILLALCLNSVRKK